MHKTGSPLGIDAPDAQTPPALPPAAPHAAWRDVKTQRRPRARLVSTRLVSTRLVSTRLFSTRLASSGAALAISACFLSACAATDARYPSVAVRDIERAEGQFEPVPSDTAATLEVPAIPISFEGTLEQHLAKLVSDAKASNTRFQASLAPARTAVRGALNASYESNAWAAAQVALAELDGRRSETAIVLADLDQLYAAARIQNEDSSAIAAARGQVAAIILQQDRILAQLRDAR